MKKFLLTIILLPLALLGQEAKYDFSKVPGVVINHSPASSGICLGSPSVCALPDGTYIASHDVFGEKAKEHSGSNMTFVYESKDKGKTWKRLAEFPQFWSGLFYHKDALYIMGTDATNGAAVIRKSLDGGKTWTDPKDSNSGLLFEKTKGMLGFHGAPVPVVLHDGRIWRAMESRMSANKWGFFSSFMLSADENADLLKAESWVMSDILDFKKEMQTSVFANWLEGNAVPYKGKMKIIIRSGSITDDSAAIIHVSEDGKTAKFKGEFARLPGASKKFTIRYDGESGKYWALTNYIPEEFRKDVVLKDVGRFRNTLALVSAQNPLESWTVESIVLQHEDSKFVGWQYVDWFFEGKDIVFVSRTSYFDGVENAKNQHDSNFMTFHRLADFRLRSMKTPPLNKM